MKESVVSLLRPDPRRILKAAGTNALTFFCKRLPVRVDGRLIQEIQALAEANEGRNIRFCLHESTEAVLHDMIILERGGNYFPPHHHADKGETLHVMEGRLAVFVFDDRGSVTDACALGPGDVYRVGDRQYHFVVPLSDPVIYHESNRGPFCGGNSEFADWAPDGKDAEAATKYVDHLLTLLEDD